MKLLQIAKRLWTVWAYCDDRDSCQVFDFIWGLDRPHRNKLLSLLQEYVPRHGPPRHNKQQAKHLDGHIWEFRKGPRRGAKYRILFFTDERNIVVCTNAFVKRSTTPPGEIQKAQTIYDQYKIDKQEGRIEVVEVTDQ